MAGTLRFELVPAHVYQRRFDSDALGEALRDCHLYIISKRPAVRTLRDSVRMHVDQVSFTASIGAASSDPRIEDFQVGVEVADRVSNFRLHGDGAYFSFRTENVVWHGDTWSLCSLAQHAAEPIACHQVLYVGQAFGDDGNTNAWERVQRHEKLQRVYENEIDGSDIFVTPLRITAASCASVDHIEDDEDGPDILGGYYGYFRDTGGRMLRPSIDIVEHALIAYFSPPYNERLTEWRADRPTEPMRRMRQAGFRLLMVHLNGGGSIARFHSNAARKPTRSHVIAHDIPAIPVPGIVRGLSAGDLTSWTAHAVGVADTEPILSIGETSDVALHVFGPQAPKIRKPSSINVDDHEDPNEEWTQEIAKLPDRVPWKPGSGFDEATGSISVGVYADNTRAQVRMFDNAGRPRHTAVIGPAASGKDQLPRSDHARHSRIGTHEIHDG